MSNNTSSMGTAHIKKICQAVLDHENGITLTVGSNAEAIKLRQVFHSMRHEDRKINKKVYKPDHPMYGASAFDSIESRIAEVEGTGIWTVTFQTVLVTLKNWTMKDAKTGEEIKLEDL